MTPPLRTDVHQHLWPMNLAGATPADVDALLDEGFVGLRLPAAALAVRGGPAVPRSPHLFYDTSSYGPDAIAAVSTVVGALHIVHGSDIPVLAAGAPADDALARANVARLPG